MSPGFERLKPRVLVGRWGAEIGGLGRGWGLKSLGFGVSDGPDGRRGAGPRGAGPVKETR